MKSILVLGYILIGCDSLAASKLADPFSVGIVGRVCVKGKCQNYSKLYKAQPELKEEANNPGAFVGEVKLSFELDGVKLVSSVTISEFEYYGNKQVNLFIKTTEEGSSIDLGSSEVIVNKMSDLNSIAQYSVPLLRENTKIEPVVLVGPSADAVRLKMAVINR